MKRLWPIILLFLLLFWPQTKRLHVFSPSEPERILVIDAGHGGFDGGGVGPSGITEQDINLSIAYRAHALAGFYGIPAILTRTDSNALNYDPSKAIRQNKVTDIKSREQIVNQTPNPVFLSIHLNKFEQSQYKGAQVFYSKNNADSKPLAEFLQENLKIGIDPQNERRVKQAESSIYLMKKLTCPAVIIECGFLSNPEEEIKLQKESYHTQLAACMINGYLKYRNT